MRTKWGHGRVLRAPWMRTYKQATKPPWGKILGITGKVIFFVIFMVFVYFLFCSDFRILSIAPFMSTERHSWKDLKEQHKLFNLHFPVTMGQVGQ